MTSSLFIHRTLCRAYSSIGSTTKPRLRCKLLSEWQPGFYFFGGEEVTPTPLSGATLTFTLKNKATGAALLHTTTFTVADEGHQADFASVDSAGLRTLLGDEVSVIVTGEIEWVITGRALRATVDVLVENAYVRPDDVAPNPVEEASETWLSERAVRWDIEQDLSTEEKARARANIGAGTGGEGGETDHGALTGLGDNDHPQYALAATMTTALAGKADASHTHAQSEVTGLVDALAGKAASSHTHAQSEVTGLVDALAGKAASSHTHAQSEVTGLVDALAAKAASSHTHAQSEVTGLVDALAGKAASSHTHAQSEVTGLVTALAGKADSGHTHVAPVEIVIACSDPTTPLTTGAAKVTFRMPFAMLVSEVKASVSTAPSGSAIVVDINASGVSIFDSSPSQKVNIDADTTTSRDSIETQSLVDTSLDDDEEITIDLDQVGSSTAGVGLVVTIIGERA